MSRARVQHAPFSKYTSAYPYSDRLTSCFFAIWLKLQSFGSDSRFAHCPAWPPAALICAEALHCLPWWLINLNSHGHQPSLLHKLPSNAKLCKAFQSCANSSVYLCLMLLIMGCSTDAICHIAVPLTARIATAAVASVRRGHCSSASSSGQCSMRPSVQSLSRMPHVHISVNQSTACTRCCRGNEGVLRLEARKVYISASECCGHHVLRLGGCVTLAQR